MRQEIELDKGYKIIYFTDELNEKVVTLFTGSSYQSVSYVGEKKYQLYDLYTNLYKVCNTHKNDIKNVLCLGGGGFSYPKYFISNYSKSSIDVVEIDKYMVEIAYKYFFLDDLIKEYDPNRTKVNIYIDDALKFIKESTKQYDSILIDLFNDNIPIYEIFDKENLKELKRLSKEDTLIAINYIVTDENKDIYEKNINDLRSCYKTVTAIALPKFKIKNKGNIFILCSDKEINLGQNEIYIKVF